MATLGYENALPYNDTGAAPEFWYYIQKVVAPADGSVTNFRAYIISGLKSTYMSGYIYNSTGTTMLGQATSVLIAAPSADWRTWTFPTPVSITGGVTYRFMINPGNLFNDSSTYRPRIGLWPGTAELIMDSHSTPQGAYSSTKEFLYGNYTPTAPAGPGNKPDGISPVGKIEGVSWGDVVKVEGIE